MTTCEHKKWHLIQSWRSAGTDGFSSFGQITICRDCGLIFVRDITNGVVFHREFRIYDDESLAAIHQYRIGVGIEK